MGREVVEIKRPTHFDMAPFQKAIKKFLNCSAEERSKIRTLFAEKQTIVRNVFKDSHNEISFKKVMDVNELAEKLSESGMQLDSSISESLGSLLLCFGDIEVDKGWGDRPPPETEEQRKAKALLKLAMEDRNKAADDRIKKAATGLYKPPTEDEENKYKTELAEEDIRIEGFKKLAKAKPPIKKMLYETSIHDLLLALDRSAEYDRMLSNLQLIPFEMWTNEDKCLKKLNRPYNQEHVQMPAIADDAKYS